ncbi:MAG: response regulator [Acidobacteria bacterium]|nr:response regulator [Acidobacteriota bacterium]
MSELKTILIVDDDPTVHHLLAAVLAPHDWRIESAFDGLEALQRVETFPYDLVLTDVHLPGLDGLELLARIRQLRPETKVMVMTADSTPDHIIRSTREQAFSYFSKPFSPSAVAEMIARAFSTPAWQDDIEVLSARPEWFTLRVRCRPETADRLVQFLREMKMDLPEQEREDMAAAFRELLMNAIEHGGGSDPNKRVRVAYVRTSRAILYYIQDPGKGFSFQNIPHAAVSNPPEAPFEHVAVRAELGLRPGGFGILLAGKLVDELIYNEKGNEVLLIKYLNHETK